MAKATKDPTAGGIPVVTAGVMVVRVKATVRTARDREHTGQSVAAIFRATAITIPRDAVVVEARIGRILRVRKAVPAQAQTGARAEGRAQADQGPVAEARADKEEVGGDRTLNCKTPLD